MDPTVITEIADYFQKEIGYEIPADDTVRRPQLQRDPRRAFTPTACLKDEEIYNIFNTKKLLEPPGHRP